MVIGGFMELILGNTFPCIVFMTFGTFWLSFGGILNPSFAAWSSYAGTKEAATGLNTVGFNSSLGKFSLLRLQLPSIESGLTTQASGFSSWASSASSTSLAPSEPTSASSSSS